MFISANRDIYKLGQKAGIFYLNWESWNVRTTLLWNYVYLTAIVNQKCDNAEQYFLYNEKQTKARENYRSRYLRCPVAKVF